MKTLTSILKCLSLGVLLASVPLVGGCGDNTLTWKEEVKLLDGRVIVVTQKRRYEGVYTGHNFANIPREAWVTFKLPEFSNQEIVWHENLDTQMLNIYEGKLYIVGSPHSEREFRQYGSPQPSYIGYRYGSIGQWVRIPFNVIPVAIYDSNMWFDNAPENGSKYVSLADKEKQMKDETYPNEIKRINPARKSH